MSWRVIVISQAAKLDLQLGYMVVRQESLTRIHISEIHSLIIESNAVALTAALLSELVNQKVKVIFCDTKRNPSAELIPHYGSHDSSLKIQQQLSWDKLRQENVWRLIVQEKIKQQAQVLFCHKLLKEAQMLKQYAEAVQASDESNREGHAAKVYFNALFGKSFKRGAADGINAALNYGYSVLLSAFNREIAIAGYFTQCGLAHCNRFNPFNLASDLMEPFRPLVDRIVLDLMPEELGRDEKNQLVDVLHRSVCINGQEQSVHRAIGIYARSVFNALNDGGELCFFTNHARHEEEI